MEFLCRPVRLSCGQQHTAVVSSSGDVYTWGRSQKGRLGHGDLIEEEGKSVPFRVEILHMHRSVACSSQCNAQLSHMHCPVACRCHLHAQLSLDSFLLILCFSLTHKLYGFNILTMFK